VGAQLAFELHRRGHQVTIIDHVGASFGHLDPGYRGRTIEGEVLNQHTLERAGVAQADGLAAVTNSDATNAVVARLARTVFHVPNVVARNYDPRLRPLHEAMGVQVVSSTGWGAQRIEELLHAVAFRALFSAGNGEVEVYELEVPAAWAGRTLDELISGTASIAVAVTRGGRAELPEASTLLRDGDLLLVSARVDGIEELRRRLAPAKE
jgi:trk system potassium uptake protein TrkA